MRRLLVFTLAILGTVTLATAPVRSQNPAPEARFAFVIGNDLYQNAPMPTASNDAGLVADTLQAAAFDVTGARNLDQDTLRAAYREFLAKVAAAGPSAVAFVYISGYGVQFQGDDYLVPGSAQIERESDIPLDAVRLTDLTGPLAALGAKAKFAIFDLAYPTPFATAPGLALIEPEPGMLVAMNAAPGTVAPVPSGSYGAYAQALAEMIRTPGLPATAVFDQVRLRTAELTKGAAVPWDASRLAGPFVFFAASPNAPQPAVTAAEIDTHATEAIAGLPVDQAYAAAITRDTIAGYSDFLSAHADSPYARTVRGLLAARREALTWRHTLDVATPQAFWSYLRRYPRGPHADEARALLARQSAAANPPANFAIIQYDIAPPPPDEEGYFDTGAPDFYDSDAPPPAPSELFLPPPPSWWTPPPPPPIAGDESYFLPAFQHRTEPDWLRPPREVAPPPAPEPPRGEPRAERISGAYIAIPAALAAGIVAGRLHNAARPAQRANVPGNAPSASPPFIPPVTAPPPPNARIPGSGPQPGINRPAPPNRPAAGVEPRPALPGSTVPTTGNQPAPLGPQRREPPRLPGSVTPGPASQPPAAVEHRPGPPDGAASPIEPQNRIAPGVGQPLGRPSGPPQQRPPAPPVIERPIEPRNEIESRPRQPADTTPRPGFQEPRPPSPPAQTEPRPLPSRRSPARPRIDEPPRQPPPPQPSPRSPSPPPPQQPLAPRQPPPPPAQPTVQRPPPPPAVQQRPPASPPPQQRPAAPATPPAASACRPGQPGCR